MKPGKLLKWDTKKAIKQVNIRLRILYYNVWQKWIKEDSYADPMTISDTHIWSVRESLKFNMSSSWDFLKWQNKGHSNTESFIIKKFLEILIVGNIVYHDYHILRLLEIERMINHLSVLVPHTVGARFMIY